MEYVVNWIAGSVLVDAESPEAAIQQVKQAHSWATSYRYEAEEFHRMFPEEELVAGYYWEVTNMVTGEIMQYDTVYPTTDHAMGAAKDIVEDTFPHFAGNHLVIKIFNKSPEERYGPPYVTYTPIRTESYWIGGERTGRQFPQAYTDWITLAEDIKEKLGDDVDARMEVNMQLGHISIEDEDSDNAKRWLVSKAGELGVS